MITYNVQLTNVQTNIELNANDYSHIQMRKYFSGTQTWQTQISPLLFQKTKLKIVLLRPGFEPAVTEVEAHSANHYTTAA